MTYLPRLHALTAATALTLGGCNLSEKSETASPPPVPSPTPSQEDCRKLSDSLHTAIQGKEGVAMEIQWIISKPESPLGVWGKLLDRSKSVLAGFDFYFEILPSEVQDHTRKHCDTHLSKEEKDSVRRQVDQLVNGYVRVFMNKRHESRFSLYRQTASEGLTHKDKDLEWATLRAYYGEVPACIGREEMSCLTGKTPKSFTVSKHKFWINIENEVAGNPGTFLIPAR